MPISSLSTLQFSIATKNIRISLYRYVTAYNYQYSIDSLEPVLRTFSIEKLCVAGIQPNETDRWAIESIQPVFTRHVATTIGN